jgi:hypothetical protein
MLADHSLLLATVSLFFSVVLSPLLPYRTRHLFALLWSSEE